MTDQSEPRSAISRRGVLRTGVAAGGALAVGFPALTGSAAAEKPDFSPRVWGDGTQWGTKVTGPIPEPENKESLDEFFVITNPVTGELPGDTLPVSEAAPRNPAYNGGRWWTHTVEWTQAGIDAHGSPPPLLTRYGPATDPESILFHRNLGHLTVTEGPPAGGPPPFFECPLLPVKD